MTKREHLNQIRQFVGEVVVALIFLSLLILGCGDGEPPLSPIDELTILSTTPASNASDVSSDTSIINIVLHPE